MLIDTHINNVYFTHLWPLTVTTTSADGMGGVKAQFVWRQMMPGPLAFGVRCKQGDGLRRKHRPQVNEH